LVIWYSWVWEDNSLVRSSSQCLLHCVLKHSSSEIIEQTRRYCAGEPSNRVLAYFYFSFRDTEKQKVSNLLSSILSQLVRQADSISDTVRALYDSYHHSQPPIDRFLSALKSMIEFHRNTFLIIDALDECPNNSGEREQLCSTIVEIKEWSASNLHILLSYGSKRS
jgi:hypothetical protein